MNSLPQNCAADFATFLSGKTEDRVFTASIPHPSQPSHYCPCGQSWMSATWFYFKASVLILVLKLPFNGLKIWLLRRMGARIGNNVYLSVDLWIDPAFPQLLTIEDNVMLGVGVKIAMHEFGQSHFSAGKVTIRQGAIIGGFAVIGHGVEIGKGAVIAGAAAVGRDVPPGMLAIGNPARIVPQINSQESLPHE
jgi:acetyltransferase-like isoleucine patch superfamily enzyme